MTKKDTEIQPVNKNITGHLISLHGQTMSYLEHESAGIWTRFNILLGVNLVLFGLTIAILNSDVVLKLIIAIFLSCLGLIFTTWSNIILKGLWDWHQGWFRAVKAIERRIASIPGNERILSRMLYGEKIALARRGKCFAAWQVFGTTQPIFVLMGVLWTGVVSYSGYQLVAECTKP